MAKDDTQEKNAPVQSATKQQLVEKVTNRYEASVRWEGAKGLTREWKEYDRFWNSDHWSGKFADHKDIKNYPRPVTNHFGEIIDMKVAALNYEPPEMYFEPHPGTEPDEMKIPAKALMGDEAPDFSITHAELLSAVFEDVSRKNNMQEKYETYSRSAAVLCTGIFFSFWDNTIEGPGYIGDIAVREIDISDFHIGNPAEPDIQKQPWIVIPERANRIQVQKEYEQHSNTVQFIQKDPQDARDRTYSHEMPEHDEVDNVTLYHYWERSWEEVEHKIVTDSENPEEGLEEEVVKRNVPYIDYYVICQDYVIRDSKKFAKRYPFSGFHWYPKRKSFHGKPESKDLISNQKELNRLQAIALLGAYKTGVPNVLFKSAYVKLEDISVGPGGNIIEDTSPAGTGWGVSYMQPPTIAPYIPLLKDSLSGGMKESSGAHEAWSGKAPSAHLNASAIMALQEAAGVRMAGIQRRFHFSLTELGMIWLELIKKYYTEDRQYRVFGKNNVEGNAWFKHSDFEDIEFDVRVTVSSASPYSKTVIATTLETMYDKGIIDRDIYLRMLPPEVFPKVKQLREIIEDREVEAQELMLEQQKNLVNEIVASIITQAREQDTQITPEVFQEMRQMIQQVSEEQANAEGQSGMGHG